MDRYRLPEYPLPRRFPWGIPEPFWLRHRELIGEFVKRYELKPVPIEHLTGRVERPAPEVNPEWFPFPWPIPFPGGLRIPHFHFRGELFELQPEQWREFTKPLVEDLRARLGRVETADLNGVMELSDAVDGLM